MTFWDWFALLGIYSAIWIVAGIALQVGAVVWMDNRRQVELARPMALSEPPILGSRTEELTPLSELPEVRWRGVLLGWRTQDDDNPSRLALVRPDGEIVATVGRGLVGWGGRVVVRPGDGWEPARLTGHYCERSEAILALVEAIRLADQALQGDEAG